MTSFPFNAVDGAPAYNSDDFRAYFKTIIPENGVVRSELYPNSMIVTVEHGLVSVSPGAACINGAAYIQDEVETLPTPLCMNGYSRYDLAVCRFDLDAREIRVQLLIGTDMPSSELDDSSEPAYLRSDSLWDIVLARVKSGGGGAESADDLRGVRQNWATVLWKDGMLPVPVAMGGTGADSAEGAREKLQAAHKAHTHDASDISSGELAIARGGLGTVNGSEGILIREASGFSLKSTNQSGVLGYQNGTYGFIPSAAFAQSLLEGLAYKGDIGTSKMQSTTLAAGVYRITTRDGGSYPSSLPYQFGTSYSSYPILYVFVDSANPELRAVRLTFINYPPDSTDAFAAEFFTYRSIRAWRRTSTGSSYTWSSWKSGGYSNYG